MNIETTVNIDFTEDHLKQMILDKIRAHNNRIVVESITFTQRRGPTRMGVDVKAYIGDGEANNDVKKTLTKTSSEEADTTKANVIEQTNQEEIQATVEAPGKAEEKEEPVVAKPSTKLFGKK